MLFDEMDAVLLRRKEKPEAAPNPEDETDKSLERYSKRVAELEPPLSALTLSGGGIRSAAFALGVVQGLAKRNLLQSFDYLSTVSGGGYTGAFLSVWIRRAGFGPVLGHLKGGHWTDTTSPLVVLAATAII